MDVKQLRGILQSDSKLWEQALTVDEGGVVTKTLFIPHGVGEFTLTFEGVYDAKGRRSAAEIWGQSIRDAVDNAIGEESVTARAAQKAAQVGADNGGHRGRRDSNQDNARQEEVLAPCTISPLGIPSTISTVPRDRRDELIVLRGQYADIIKGLDLEIKALIAYVEVMDAQATTTETPSSSTAEDTE